MKQLYYCVERGSYEPVEYWGWFEDDKEAIKLFKKTSKSWKNIEWYVGRIIEFKGIKQDPTTEDVAVFKT